MFVKDLKRDKEYILPLTELQKEMLFSVTSNIYDFIEKVNIRFEEEIDIKKLENALENLISLHPMLRCVFRWENISSPISIVLKEVEVPIYYKSSSKKIDLEKEPWYIVISEDYKCLEFTYSHLIMDGWSLGCFFEQLFSFYSRKRNELLKTNNSMRKYFISMKNKNFSEEENYWKNFWKGYSPVMLSDTFSGNLNIPGNEYNTFLDIEDYKKLKSFASSAGVSISSVLYLAWGILLGSYSRKKEICMGYISSGRNNGIINFDSIGMYIKSLPLRINLNGQIKELCQEVSRQMITNSKYENASNQMIFNGSKRNLYDSLLVVENYPLDVDRMKKETEIKIDSFDFNEDVSYPYVVQIQLKDRIDIMVTGETSDSYEQLKNLGDTYLYILKQLSNEDVTVVSDVMICDNETNNIFDFEKGKTTNKKELNTTLTQYITSCCKNNSSKVAIIDGDHNLKYQEIYDKAKKISGSLRNMGIVNGTPIGVYMGRSSKMLISVYSIIFAAAAYLPLSRSLPNEKIKYIVDNSNAKVIICDSDMDKDNIKIDNPNVRIVTYDELLNDDFENNIPEYDYSYDNTAYIIYTSGTTGLPKGVEISHRAILNRLIWNSKEIGLSSDDVQLFKTPISFDVSIIEIFQIFFNEHKLIVLPETYEKMPDIILEYINKYSVTYLHFVPSMFEQFISYIKEMHKEKLIDSLKKIVCSGEVLQSNVVNQFYSLGNNSKVDIINLYGPTEAAVDVSSFVSPKCLLDGIIPIGKPIYNTELRILDNYKRRCNPYVIGELYILGENLGKGYINDKQKTQQSYFLLDDGKRCYYTGDLAYWDKDGNIIVIGRGDSQIKYNGVRIECEEIRSFLINNNIVKDAELMIIKEGMDQLVLFFVSEEKDELEIRKVMKDNFAKYMLPTRYFHIDEIPLTAHGKRDIKKLSNIYSNQIKEKYLESVQEQNLKPLEIKLVRIWEKLLGNIIEGVSKKSNFFEFGGNSLMIISMITMIKKETNVILSTAEVYNNSVLEDLANLIEAKQNSNIEESEENCDDINSVQKGIAAYQFMNKDSTAYNMPISIKIKEGIDIKQIYEAVLSIIKQDSYLRSIFVFEDGNLKRKTLEYHSLPFKCIEIEEDEVEEYCKNFVKPFMLDNLMIRIEFLSTSKDKYMLFDIHHILCNQEVLKRILDNLIRCIEGKKINKIQLKSNTVNNDKYEQHKKYWIDNFSEHKDGTLLPKDRHSKTKNKVLSHWKFELDDKMVKKIREFALENDTTSFVVLLSVFICLCWKSTKKDYISIGTNFINNGENQGQVAGLEVLPIKVDINSKNSLKEILQLTKQRFSKAIENNMYSYNELIHDLNISLDSDVNPLFEMMFVKEEDLFFDDKITNYFCSVENISKTGKFDLSIFYKEYENNMIFSFDYNSEEYNKDTIIFFADAYQEMIASMLDDDTISIKDTRVLSMINKDKYYSPCFGERRLLENKSIQKIMMETAKRIPDQVAIFCGDKKITYKEFDLKTNIIANALSRFEIENKGVIISMSNSDKLLMLIFGILKAGGFYIPVDNNLPKAQKNKIIVDSQAVLYVSDSKVESLENINCVMVDELLNCSSTNEICKDNTDSFAYCIYTSGSTGNPKGCKVKQKELLNYIDWANRFYCLKDHKTFAFYTSPAVDMSITSTIMPLVYGHTIVVYPNNATSILNVVQDNRIQIVKATPSHLSLISKEIKVTPQIETFIVGGENLHSNVANYIYNKFNKHVHIYNEYGPTECVVGCMIYEYNENDNLASVPIGKPIQNMFTVVLDENKNICLPYTKGELYIGGYGVIGGYINNKELTSKKFVKNTINLEYSENMYASGDVVRIIDNGNIECFGRNDNQVKINGRRIELGEVESAATKVEGIRQAVALYDEKKRGIVLFYENTERKVWKEIAFRKELSKYIPYYMMPVQIVKIEKFSLLKSGKIDTKSLLNMDLSTSKSNITNSNTSIEVEQYLSKCVTEVLGHNKFTKNDGFFEMGLNSLSIVNVHQLISKKYDIDVMDMFRYPSIYSLTSYILDYDEKTEDNSNVYENEDFAIVGIGFQVRGAENLAELRNVFKSEQSMIAYPTGQRYDDVVRELKVKGYSENEYKMGMNASLERIDLFDPSYYKIGKDEADALDPVQRLFMMNATKALYDAGFTKDSLYGSKTGVICANSTPSGYTEYIEEYYPQYAQIAKLNKAHSIMLTRIQHYYNMIGPSYLVDSACSSGLVAMSEACKQLLSGECDAVLVGGVNLIEIADVFDEKRAQVLSNNFHAETFSDLAKGTARGEGCICYVVKRLSDAINNKDKIYAVIRGMAMNNDGFSSSITAPNGNAQKRVIEQALKNARVSPSDIGIVETHGTATPLGDPIEVKALTEAYSLEEKTQQYCALSASKAVYGHMDSISGLMGLLKCIVSLKYKEIYSNFQVIAPNRRIDFMSSPFFVPNSTRKWKRNKNKTRYCGLSNFGLSGTNVHMIIQQWPLESDEISEFEIDNKVFEKVERCWIDVEPEICSSIKKINVQKKHFTEKLILEDVEKNLLNKVSQLFPERNPDIYEDLYSLGFDSISIIQLQQYIKSKYDLDIDITYFFERLNTLELLSKYILKEQKIVDNSCDHKIKEETYVIKKVENSIENKVYDTIPDYSEYALKSFMNEFSDEYKKKTQKSYELMNKDKVRWANGRFILGKTKGLEELSYPIIVNKAKGTMLTDLDGNKYLDFAMGFGANFFGYNNDKIKESVKSTLDDEIVLGAIRPEPFDVAEQICNMTGVERVSFCNSGSEAVMNILRIARAATRRKKIITFNGSFHGTFDPIFTQANETGDIHALPKSIGTPMEFVSQTLMFPYGEEDVFNYLDKNYNDVAAIIVEPVQSRHPKLRPKEFVKKLRSITEELGILLVFDEVITGFRSGLKGAQGYYGIEADLVSYGKVIGGGYPIGVFAGKSKYMDLIDHKGWSEVSQNKKSGYLVNTGGTFNAHPVSIAAAKAVCEILQTEGDEIYTRINNFTDYLAKELNSWFSKEEIDIQVEYFKSQFIFISKNIQMLRLMQYLLIYNNIYVWEGGTCFISTEHTKEQIDHFIDVVKKCGLIVKKVFYSNYSNVKISKYIDSKENIEKILNKSKNVEKIYPMTKQQIAVMTSNITNRNKKMNVSYMLFDYDDIFEESRLMESFEKTVNLFEELRSMWVWRGVKHPVRVVLKEVSTDTKFHFVETMSQKIAEDVIDARKAQGINLKNPPYLALDIITDNNVSKVILSFYTSVVDGWSIDLFLKTLMEVYNGKKLEQNIFDYERYLDWINNDEENQKSMMFWKDYLKDLSIKKKEHLDETSDEMETYIWKLEEEDVLKIHKISKAASCSIASILLYCYGKAINQCKDDCLVASTITGRNQSIPGMLDAIGMFSNIVPIRINAINNIDSIKNVDLSLKRVNQLVPYTIDEIAQYTNIASDELRNIITSATLVILNQSNQDSSNEMKLVEDHGYLAVPLRTYATVNKYISLLFTYSNKNISREDIERIISEFRRVLKSVCEEE
ncbi:MAG: amino acid adenylation domain-containing protein [Clostridium sp.]|nr:amino acid adenylation domain-containing protein [Clostridium sp.]